MITASVTSPVPLVAAPASAPKVWKRGEVGLGIGTGWTTTFGGPIGTEFGRGRLGLGTTQGYDMYYEDELDAIRAASYLSNGQQGAITIDHANFIGAQLRTVDVISDGLSQVPNPRPVPYRFEELAETARGRRELETNLKLDRGDYLIDGGYIAVADRDGGVKVHEIYAYLDSLKPAS